MSSAMIYLSLVVHWFNLTCLLNTLEEFNYVYSTHYTLESYLLMNMIPTRITNAAMTNAMPTIRAKANSAKHEERLLIFFFKFHREHYTRALYKQISFLYTRGRHE